MVTTQKKRTPTTTRMADGTTRTGYIDPNDNRSYFDDGIRVTSDTGAQSVSTGTKTFNIPGSGVAPAYGSNIANFNPNDPKQKELADLGQLWWQAKTQQERDTIAKQGAELRAGLGEGASTFNPATGMTTFSSPTGGGTTTGGGRTYTENMFANADVDARKLAQSKVDRYMSEARASITDFLNRLKSTREKGIRSAELSAEQQRRALQDRGFLQSRATQQAMTGRGLTGSGIAEDAQTRLALQGQQELSQLFSNLGQQKFSIEEQYRLAEEEKLRELQNLEANKSNLTEEEFQNALDRIYNRTNQKLSALFQEANLTGMYGGQPTLAAQQFSYQQARDLIGDAQWQQQFDENVRQFGLGYAINEAQVTGKFGGQPTLAAQQWQQGFDYQKDRDTEADKQWQSQFDFQKDQAKIADANWNKQFDENVRQYNASQKEAEENRKAATAQFNEQLKMQGKQAEADAFTARVNQIDTGLNNILKTKKDLYDQAYKIYTDMSDEDKKSQAGLDQLAIADQAYKDWVDAATAYAEFNADPLNYVRKVSNTTAPQNTTTPQNTTSRYNVNPLFPDWYASIYGNNMPMGQGSSSNFTGTNPPGTAPNRSYGYPVPTSSWLTR